MQVTAASTTIKAVETYLRDVCGLSNVRIIPKSRDFHQGTLGIPSIVIAASAAIHWATGNAGQETPSSL